MLIKSFSVGQLQTNCYVLSDDSTLDCALIDPGAESGRILNYLEDNNLKCRFIFLTHGHFDHTTAAPEISTALSIPIFIHQKDAATNNTEPYLFTPTDNTSYFCEGDLFSIGGLNLSVLETPGHSPGSVTLRCNNALFTGDTLFKDSCGRTDLPGGAMSVLSVSLKRLYSLSGDFEVYPGHASSTTLDAERRFNYYMKYAVEGNA